MHAFSVPIIFPARNIQFLPHNMFAVRIVSATIPQFFCVILRSCVNFDVREMFCVIRQEEPGALRRWRQGRDSQREGEGGRRRGKPQEGIHLGSRWPAGGRRAHAGHKRRG